MRQLNTELIRVECAARDLFRSPSATRLRQGRRRAIPRERSNGQLANVESGPLRARYRTSSAELTTAREGRTIGRPTNVTATRPHGRGGRRGNAPCRG
ncbi:unnamed protein product, partial [Iphiclides podalirius]